MQSNPDFIVIYLSLSLLLFRWDIRKENFLSRCALSVCVLDCHWCCFVTGIVNLDVFSPSSLPVSVVVVFWTRTAHISPRPHQGAPPATLPGPEVLSLPVPNQSAVRRKRPRFLLAPPTAQAADE